MRQMADRVRSGLSRLLGREPVMAVATVVSLVVAGLPVFGWSSEVTGSVSAAVVAIGGAVAAGLVSADRALPLLVGMGQAVVAAAASFGVHLPEGHVSALLAVLAILGGLATRPQVSAKQPARHRDENGDFVYHLQPHTTYALDTTLEYREAGPDTEVMPAVPRDAPPLPQPPTRTEVEQRGQQRERDGRHHRHDFRETSGKILPDFGVPPR